jgi:site-specific DNA recombinase
MTEELWAAFLRCSNEELQDPNLSLDRQLRNCETAVARWGGRIVAVYYEVETGAARYEQRGTGTRLVGFDIPIPRAGGLHELVADATRKPRQFGRVICESIGRLARNSAVAFTLEDQFRAAGVSLHCADEPFEESFGSIVLRHLNVGLARGYLFNLKQASRQGSETATRQGWHMGGIPLYGYRLDAHDHPNPHKRKRGLHRHTLDLDPVRGSVVRRIFDAYLYGNGGLTEIRDLLNSDLDRFPPPVPTDPARRATKWSRSTIWFILRNPKYTGFQVWNRRANKTGRGRHNAPEQWTWSEEPSHPAIISRTEYEQVQVKAAHNQRSRRTAQFEATALHKPDYVFRSRIKCVHCNLRMWSSRRRGTSYYLCQPSHQRGEVPPDHPRTVYVNERALVWSITDFLATAIYGRDRVAYWERVLVTAERHDETARLRAHISDQERSLLEVQGRLDRQVLNLEANDLPPQARQRIIARIGELEAELARAQASLARLHGQAAAAPPDVHTVRELLATFPLKGDELRELPFSDLRDLFASLDLMAHYDHQRHRVQVSVTLTAGQGDAALLGSGLLRRQDSNLQPWP